MFPKQPFQSEGLPVVKSKTSGLYDLDLMFSNPAHYPLVPVEALKQASRASMALQEAQENVRGKTWHAA